MKEFTIEPKADQRPDHRIANALDDAVEQIVGRRDYNRAHGDETCNTLGDRWNSLQAFMGAAS
jgi:hypothetical protein